MKFHKIIVAFLLTAHVAYAEDVHSNMAEVMLTAELQGSEGNKEKAIDGLIKKLGSIGYSTVAGNKNIQVHYYNKFDEKNVEMLSFFGVVNKEKIRPLLLANPDFGAYAPFNFLVYKTLDTQNDNNTWYGHLAPDTMLDIVGEKDASNRKAFKSMVGSLDTLINKELTPALSKKFEHTKALPVHGLTKFVKKFEKTDDLETFVEDFIEDHDGRFSKHDFIIAGFIDYKFEYEDMDMDFDKYDAYWVSMLCHFKFSNSIFNRGMPEAGMFAPCSVYFYIPKGTNELHVGYASVDNWINALNFKDQRRIDYMKAIDAEVADTFKEMGFSRVQEKAISSGLKAPATHTSEIEVLKAELAKVKRERDALKKTSGVPIVKEKKVEDEQLQNEKKNTSKLKSTVPPKQAKKAQKVFTTPKVSVGAKAGEMLSAYYAAQPQSLSALKTHLQTNGFTILSETQILKNHMVLSVTNKELQSTNTFMAVLNIHLNLGEEIRVQNPSYLGRAYLQDTYKEGEFTQTITALEKALGTLYEVQDKYKTKDLSTYQFMMGMPQFDDMIELSEASHLEETIMSDKAKKYIAYTLKLPNGTVLVGHKLSKQTNMFLSTIGSERNSNLLPYQSLIKGDKVVILDPKYYLALSLPLLSMADFMKISSVPRGIEKEIEHVYMTK